MLPLQKVEQKGTHKLCVHHLCNSVKALTSPVHECRNICMERWTVSLLLSAGVVGCCVAVGKALHETRYSYKQAVLGAAAYKQGAGRQSFLGIPEAPLTYVSVHLRGSSVSLWGQGLTDYMFLPFVIQAWNSSAAIPAQSHCEQGCSPQPGAFKGNESPPFRCAKLPDQYGFPQILQRGLFLCLICQRPASGI